MILAYIEFLDHYSDGDEWTDLDELKSPAFEPVVCRSVGWVLAENKKMLKLITTIDGDPETAGRGFGIFCIVKADIVRRVDLVIPKPIEEPPK